MIRPDCEECGALNEAAVAVSFPGGSPVDLCDDCAAPWLSERPWHRLDLRPRRSRLQRLRTATERRHRRARLARADQGWQVRCAFRVLSRRVIDAVDAIAAAARSWIETVGSVLKAFDLDLPTCPCGCCEYVPRVGMYYDPSHRPARSPLQRRRSATVRRQRRQRLARLAWYRSFARAVFADPAALTGWMSPPWQPWQPWQLQPLDDSVVAALSHAHLGVTIPEPAADTWPTSADAYYRFNADQIECSHRWPMTDQWWRQYRADMHDEVAEWHPEHRCTLLGEHDRHMCVLCAEEAP